jgi:hypothetical protein
LSNEDKGKRNDVFTAGKVLDEWRGFSKKIYIVQPMFTDICSAKNKNI